MNELKELFETYAVHDGEWHNRWCPFIFDEDITECSCDTVGNEFKIMSWFMGVNNQARASAYEDMEEWTSSVYAAYKKNASKDEALGVKRVLFEIQKKYASIPKR